MTFKVILYSHWIFFKDVTASLILRYNTVTSNILVLKITFIQEGKNTHQTKWQYKKEILL